MRDSKGLLVLRYPINLTPAQTETLAEELSPLAERLGVEALILGNGADARLEYGSSALLERICAALEALVRQGEPPEVSEAQNAPQALNARPAYDGRNGNGYQPVGGAMNARPPRER